MTARSQGRMGHGPRSAQRSFVCRTFERSGHTPISSQSYDAKGYRVASTSRSSARFIKSVLAMDDDEARVRIKEIAAHCKTLLGAEDDGDPEMEKGVD